MVLFCFFSGLPKKFFVLGFFVQCDVVVFLSSRPPGYLSLQSRKTYSHDSTLKRRMYVGVYLVYSWHAVRIHCEVNLLKMGQIVGSNSWL